jgi:hypothetical protein
MMTKLIFSNIDTWMYMWHLKQLPDEALQLMVLKSGKMVMVLDIIKLELWMQHNN